ncbi:adhesion G-protein coupled receptor G2-like [Liolophura sinensis]|uniref:adhesion G-protein coupled receptor G2-like n=1 Tax=Liolophura sinensis TaxID=3198878 RepID=UPI0031591958
MDYGCGAAAFCDSTLAKFEKPHCLKCEKCHCDDVCTLYGDCCVDRLFDEDTDSLIVPTATCQPQHPRGKQSEVPFLFMMTSCPPDTQTDNLTKTKCERPSSSVLSESTPVSVRTTQVTYRNAYCASCHGQTYFMEWSHEVSCSKRDILRTAEDKDHLWALVMTSPACTVKSFPPLDINTRNCFSGLQGNCNVKSSTNLDVKVQKLCGMFNRPVKEAGTKYKNIFCVLCKRQNILSRTELCREVGEFDPIEKTYPLSVLIDFNPKPRLVADLPVPEQVATVKCNYTELYDPLSESCRKAKCSYGRIRSGDTCELALHSSAGVGYSGSLALKFTEKLNWAEWNDLVEQFTRSELHKSLQKFSPFMFTEMTRSIYALPPKLDGFLITEGQASGAKIDFNFVSISSAYIPQLEDALKRVHSLELKNYTVGEKRGTLSSFGLPCPSKISEVLNGIPRETSISNDLPFAECELPGRYCDFDSVTYEPVLHILNCPYLEFNLSDYNMKLDLENSSLEIYNQTIHLEKTDFLSCGDTIKICSRGLSDISETLKSPVDENIPVNGNRLVVSVSPALTVVSVVCIALSLLCLFLTFLVYCLLPQLRTLPGKNTMVLVAYLFCAQLFFQVGINLTYNKNLCRAMAVFIHYLWIATYMSMGTCAFHMYTVFTTMSFKSFQNTIQETKKFIRYLIISNAVAVLIVGVCIGYHAGSSGGREIGYGGSICFINTSLDIGIFFAGPLAVVLVFNIFCFIRVAISIRNVPNMKTAKIQANRNHAKVYFRLSILLGFTWIFGFVAVALQLEVLWYIFVILNGLQGVSIFIAYCLNRRILIMMKTLCCGKTSDKYSKAQVNSPVASTESSAL